jgi:hypothetical protein
VEPLGLTGKVKVKVKREDGSQEAVDHLGQQVKSLIFTKWLLKSKK